MVPLVVVFIVVVVVVETHSENMKQFQTNPKFPTEVPGSVMKHVANMFWPGKLQNLKHFKYKLKIFPLKNKRHSV